MAAQGVKIIGKELEKALAGLPLYVAHNEDEVEYYKVMFSCLHNGFYLFLRQISWINPFPNDKL